MKLEEAINLVSSALETNKLWQHTPYPWQTEFHNAGADNAERLLMAANGVGKTLTGGYEVAVHLTGEYPSWWKGVRFKGAVKAWVGSITNETQREFTQPVLLGGLGELLGTGFIPKDRIYGKPSIRQSGIGDVVDYLQVKHKSGGISRCLFKTYEQGWRKWQGSAPHVVWLDEQPDETQNEKGIYSECQTRVFRTGGIILSTLTPLLGETDFIRHFTQPKTSGIYWIGATWDDAPHLDEKEKKRLAESYPEHELETRTLGVPMMGEGRVFTVPESQIKCEPFEIPKHFFHIAGIDFGIDHPAATAWLAWDKDADIIYVWDCYRKSNETPVYHAHAINTRGKWIPVAWPHDGLQRGKADGEPLYKQYKQHDVNMLNRSARYKNETGGSQAKEPVVLDVLERMRTGRFKVFNHLTPWFEEFRSYHRKEGRIVDRKDDVLCATFYAVMMKRYARQPETRSKARDGSIAPMRANQWT